MEDGVRQALQHIDEIVKLQPQNTQAIKIRDHFQGLITQSTDKYNRGDSLFGEGKYQEALEMATAAVNLNPQNAVAHCLMASCFRELGKLPEALDEST